MPFYQLFLNICQGVPMIEMWAGPEKVLKYLLVLLGSTPAETVIRSRRGIFIVGADSYKMPYLSKTSRGDLPAASSSRTVFSPLSFPIDFLKTSFLIAAGITVTPS